MLAGADSVDITVRGYGGHGAAPQAGKDPIMIASEVVVALQTVVSREMDPQVPTVVTVGHFTRAPRTTSFQMKRNCS